MLLRFRFSNFRSFRTEQELSMIAAPITGSKEGLLVSESTGERVLPAYPLALSRKPFSFATRLMG